VVTTRLFAYVVLGLAASACSQVLGLGDLSDRAEPNAEQSGTEPPDGSPSSPGGKACVFDTSKFDDCSLGP
jgi:hypothetical protein